MDRRQRKTREAIFKAFIFLLSKKNFNSVTVGEIISLADVGRATFYAHFETKDFLLKELCAELFDHIFGAETECVGGHNPHSHGDSTRQDNSRNLFDCEEKGAVFLHLFRHIQKNDNNIARLLSSENNELFLEYFKNGVKRLVMEHIEEFSSRKPDIVPQNFWVNHVTVTFIETLRWWLSKEMAQSPEEISEYFLQSV